MILGWMVLGPEGINVISTRYAIGMGTLGMLAMVGGLSLVKDEMADGAGFASAKIGVLLMVLGLGAGMVESALEVARAEATSPGDASLFATAAQSVGALTTTVSMLGFAVVGIAFYVRKNVPTILALLFTLVGILGMVGAATAYENDMVMMPGYIGMMLLTLVLGIVRLRAKA
jgi:hypothetical protein